MANPYWPLFDLRITTPRLEIRLPTDEELYLLLEVTDAGVHDPATMPFALPWTDVTAPRRHRESLQWWWSQRARWRPDDWSFTGAVFVDGEPVGVQDMAATTFAARRVVTTGSWIGRAHQGEGIGKEMRAAMLHLAFDGLGAREAHTGAFEDNHSSLGVTRALGYAENGHDVVLRRGRRARQIRFCLEREVWASERRDDITITGLEGCRDMFGLEDAPAGPPPPRSR
ncbi:MAG: GNAT family N-acetyltransferase [Acidimicrobiales bacterium]